MPSDAEEVASCSFCRGGFACYIGRVKKDFTPGTKTANENSSRSFVRLCILRQITRMLLRSLGGAALLLFAAQGWAASSCSGLKDQGIPPDQIGLPTRGALVLTSHAEKGPNRGYCRVLGQVRSVDPAAEPIRFEVNLPEQWNGKALQFGGGAFDGYLHQSDGRRATVLGDRSQPTPLDRGFVTFGSDSGHHHRYLLLPDILNAVNARFALNEEQRRNFASDGLKKTHDVAVALMQARYGSTPKRMYFIGGSTGGREAMKVVDRWPGDYDGVIAAYAAWNQIESDLQFIRVSQAMYAKGKHGEAGWLTPAKTRLLRDAVMNACDAADGLKDGIVSDPAGCQFDPDSLRCAEGKDGKGCLSAGQLRTVAAFSTPQISSFAVENGMDREPGYNVLRGADLAGSMGLSKHPFHPPLPLFNSFYYLVGDGVLRFFLTSDPHFNLFTFDPKTGGEVGGNPAKYIAGIRQQSVEDDASLADPDVFPTARRQAAAAARRSRFHHTHGRVGAAVSTDHGGDGAGARGKLF